MLTWTELLPTRDERRFDRRIAWGVILGYPLLYALGFLSKTVPGPAAIWPSNAPAFAAFMLLPARLWPLVAAGILSWEMLSRWVLYWAAFHTLPSLASSCSFALANMLASAGPAALARGMRLFRTQDRFQFVVSPLWIIALFAGVLPGALLGASAGARAVGLSLTPADIVLWVLASVLTIVTLAPMVFGLIFGFSEPAPTPAKAWERWA